jgi:hypothetical protein
MIINIVDDLYVKNDNHSICMALDKGICKFPNGISARYYKPKTWHNSINNCLGRLNRDNVKPSNEFIEYCNHESKFFDKLIAIDRRDDLEIGNHFINYSDGKYPTFILKCSSKHKYHNKFGLAVVSSYIHTLIEDIEHKITSFDMLYSIIKNYSDILDI